MGVRRKKDGGARNAGTPVARASAPGVIGPREHPNQAAADIHSTPRCTALFLARSPGWRKPIPATFHVIVFQAKTTLLVARNTRP
jgi:hypothetical protein